MGFDSLIISHKRILITNKQGTASGSTIIQSNMMMAQNEQKEKSLQNCNHSHPYEYLTNLNNIYTNYNRTAGKDYSSASKIKLPFKKFNTIKVPHWFEDSYAKEKKQLIQYNATDEAKTDDTEKRLWKEHREIIKKYLQEKGNKKSTAILPKNKEFAQKMLLKDRNNIFLKKIIEKGTKFEYDQHKLEEEILYKLKNLNCSSKKMPRCHTAKPAAEVKQAQAEHLVPEEKRRISERDYLQFQKEGELIRKYKGLIKQADCSISEKNISRTVALIQNMQRIVDQPL